jgi:NADH-dependent peroxiredoxin subunit C
MVQIGQTIEDFEVQAYFKDEFLPIRLSDYRGKWLILLFYPADFTFVCPTELAEAADYYEQFKTAGAEVMSVSTDTHYVHKAWHDASPAIKKVQYPMLADPTGKLCKYFGTYIEAEGLSYRATFIIDPDGMLKCLDIHDNSIGRSSAEILRKLQASIFVRAHHGEVCPASWKPGAQALHTSIDLVGKI